MNSDPDAGLNEAELRKRLRQFRAILTRARSGDRRDLERLLAVEALAGASGELGLGSFAAPPMIRDAHAEITMPFHFEAVLTRITVQYMCPHIVGRLVVGTKVVIEGTSLDVLARDMPLVHVPQTHAVLRLHNGGAAHDLGTVTFWGVA